MSVLLLVLYGLMACLSALNFLPPPVLDGMINYSATSVFARITLQLVFIGMMSASGLTIVLSTRIDARLRDEQAVGWLATTWLVIVIITLVAATWGQTEGRYGLEIPTLLDVVILVWMGVSFALMIRSLATWEAMPIVYGVGATVVFGTQLLGLAAFANPVTERVMRVLSVNLQLNVGFLLVAVSVAFWLVRRFSDVRQAWADTAVYNVGGLVALAGAFVSGQPLVSMGQGSAFGVLAMVITPIAMVIVAAHFYRALSTHNSSRTLSGHWVSLFVVLVFLGLGVLGTINSAPNLAIIGLGTRLYEAQHTLIAWAVLAVFLGMVNQAVAELRGTNERITGLLPFWLVGAGTLGAGLALLVSGAIQLVLERMLNVGYLDTQTLLAPVYLGWILALGLLALGLAIYGLGFRARRVRSTQ